MRESDALYTTPAMAALFSAETHVRQMLRFEAALAQAEAQVGLIPASAAACIAAQSQVAEIDVAALYREAAVAGTPAIPLVRWLTEHVGGDAGRFVHWGATSQDAIDTALVLQMRDGLDLLIADLHKLGAACATLSKQHRHTLMVGRTLLQQALPMTFGLKTARWLALVTRQIRELQAQRAALVVQLGGAAGTLASLAEHGLAVVTGVAELLGLAAPDLPWHTERDRVAALACALGVTAGAMAKIAGDITLLAQTEVGEVAEVTAPGKGGSSALPHKRNPVDAVAAAAAARLALGLIPTMLAAMAQEHERAAGGWQAEWVAIPDLFCYTAGAVSRVRQGVEGLQVDTARMRANLDLGGGLVMAEALSMTIAPHLGRPAAQRLAQDLCDKALQTGRSLRAVALADEQVCRVLAPDAIEYALDPAHYLGSTAALIDRALAGYAELTE